MRWRSCGVNWRCLVVGAVNLYVAYEFSQEFWVKFKLFGMLGLTVVFVVIQSVWLGVVATRNKTLTQDPE